jgi:CYTH domain-containing protein
MSIITKNMSNIEIERKFLIHTNNMDIVPLCTERCIEIRQGYLCINKGGKEEVRIRSLTCGDDQYFYITVKKETGLKRGKWETQIDGIAFGVLAESVEKWIKKRRHHIRYWNHLIELDVFEDDLQGLIIAEVEFASEDEACKFVIPKWM